MLDATPTEPLYQAVKKAILVLGPESSGLHLMTNILIACGCQGNAGEGPYDEQPWDKALPTVETPIVWRRSFPHGGKWTDVGSMVGKLQILGYDVSCIIMVREYGAMLDSQVRHVHVQDAEKARVNIRQSYEYIFHYMTRRNAPYVLVSYESLIYQPAPTIANLLKALGLPPFDPYRVIEGVGIENRNTKHYV